MRPGPVLCLLLHSLPRAEGGQPDDGAGAGWHPQRPRAGAGAQKALTGPNQRWCWDISYLLTFEKGRYLHLYLLLDEFSRKAVHWRISWAQTAPEGRLLIEGGLGDENILDLPEDQRPELLNDRGRQMKAKPIRQLCEDHQMPHLFARPRTPNDNPFIESAFSTVKRAPEYPGQFRDDTQAVKIDRVTFPRKMTK